MDDARRTEEVEAKLASLRGWMEAAGHGAVVLASQAGFAWATAGGHAHVALGEEAGVAWVLVTPDAAVVASANIERARLLDEEVTGLPFESAEWPWSEPEAAAALVAERCDPARAVADLPVLGLPPAGPGLAALRLALLPGEEERFRRLGRDAAEALEAAARAARPGDAELDVAARLAAECVARDASPLVNLVAADERIARYRHPLPTPNRLRRTLMAVVCARRHGLVASCTRMVSFGPPDDELAARHAAAAAVDARLILGSRPGATLGEVLRAGIDEYRVQGFADEWRLHHQGGLAGYAPREAVATPASAQRLAPHQALAWNPSVTRAKSEDTVLLLGDGVEVLTRTGAWPEREASSAAGSLVRPALLVA